MEELSNFYKKIQFREQKKGESSGKYKSFKRFATRLPKYNHYISLNISGACLLEEAFNAKIMSLLPLARSVNSIDRSKQCRYHQNYGHTTKECVALKDMIEELIQEGTLNNYTYRATHCKYGHTTKECKYSYCGFLLELIL